MLSDGFISTRKADGFEKHTYDWLDLTVPLPFRVSWQLHQRFRERQPAPHFDRRYFHPLTDSKPALTRLD